MRNCRKSFFLNLIKLAARRDDIEAIKGILEFKYPGDRRNPGFAVQYYEKFVKGKNLPTPLTEDNLPQPLPETAEEKTASPPGDASERHQEGALPNSRGGALEDPRQRRPRGGPSAPKDQPRYADPSARTKRAGIVSDIAISN